MKQVRKDVRHLWLSIAIVMVLTAAHAVFDVLSGPVYIPETARVNAIANLLNLLLPLSLWFLIAQLIFQEALPGDRQFWLTRPYRWTSLLAAKVIFVIIFASVPLFVSDCYILGVQGLGVFGVMPGLLLRQLLLAAVFILPSFALAAVTTGLLQFLLAWFILLLAFVCEVMLGSRGTSFEVFSGTALVVGFTAIFIGIVIWQYAKRRTTAARVVLLTATCAFLPVMSAARYLPFFHPAARTLPESPKGFDIRIGYDTGRSIPSSTSWSTVPEGFVVARIPLSVTGLPPQTLLRGTARTTIRVGGRNWPEAGQMWAGSVERIGDEYWHTLTLEKRRLKALEQESVSLHASFDFEVMNDRVEATMSLAKPSFLAPNLGLCHAIPSAFHAYFTCRTGLAESVETSIQYGPGAAWPERMVASVPQVAVPWGLSPTTQTLSVSFGNDDVPKELALIPRRKVTEFHRALDVPTIQLARYVLPPYQNSSQQSGTLNFSSPAR